MPIIKFTKPEARIYLLIMGIIMSIAALVFPDDRENYWWIGPLSIGVYLLSRFVDKKPHSW